MLVRLVLPCARRQIGIPAAKEPATFDPGQSMRDRAGGRKEGEAGSTTFGPVAAILAVQLQASGDLLRRPAGPQLVEDVAAQALMPMQLAQALGRGPGLGAGSSRHIQAAQGSR